MAEQINYSRQIYGYFDLLGDLGGVMEIFQVVFGFLLLPVAYHSFIVKATSKLFKAKTKDNHMFKPKKKKEKIKPEKETGETYRNLYPL